MPKTEMPFGVDELSFRGRDTCPIEGCTEASPCPTHHVAVRSTRGGYTYVYSEPSLNLIWTDADDQQRLNEILGGKRESRMGYEHSEDAVTWNVFRFFERNARVSRAISTIFPCPADEPLTVFWTTHGGSLWEPYRRCSDLIPDKAIARSESDLIFLWKHKLLVTIEAKFRSPNRSNLKKRADELRKSRPYICHASPYLNPNGAEEAVREGWYELLRNWALGTTLKHELGCEKFVLVNLLRRRHEKEHGENPNHDFAERACLLSPSNQFAVAYWEDLISAAASVCDHPDSILLMNWAKNKSELLGNRAFDF